MNSEFSSDLSSDVEWMLQSGQVDDAILLKALIQQYRTSLYLLALGYLGDPPEAKHACSLAFSNALLNAYRYRGDGVEAWFYQHALKSLRETSHKLEKTAIQTILDGSESKAQALWQAVSVLPDQHRELILLHEVLGIPKKHLAQIFRWEVQQVDKRLADARVMTVRNLSYLRVREQDISPDSLTPALSKMIENRWPEWDSLLPDEDNLFQEAMANLMRMGRVRNRCNSLKESMLVVVFAVIFVLVLWRVNAWMTEPESISIAAATSTASAHARETARVQPRITLSPRRQSPAQTYYRVTFPSNAFYIVGSRDTLDVIAKRLGVTTRALQRLNRLPEGAPLEEGQRLLIPGRVTPNPISTPAPDPHPESTQTPLPENPTAEDLLGRLWGGYGGGAKWADIEIVLYVGEGYLGPPQHLRVQVWISENGWPSLYLFGHPNRPETAVMMTGDAGLIALPGQDSPWFRPLEQEENYIYNQLSIFRYAFGTQIFSIYRHGEPDPGIVRREPYRGSDAFVLEALDSQGSPIFRYWIDEDVFVPLRVEEFNPNGDLIYETELRGFANDIILPQDLFDAGLPWRGGFAKDFTGEPEPVNATPLLEPKKPPARLDDRHRGNPDISHSTLTFQYPERFDLFRSLNWGEAAERVQVFADGIFLGEIPFYQPLFTQCKRSPDGKRIAYSSFGLPQPSENMYIYDLEEGSLETPFDGVFVSEFAFSPDGSMLALAGRDDDFSGISKVRFYEFETGRLSAPIEVEEAHSLTWKPDGTQLALLYSNYNFRGSSGYNYADVIAIWDVSTGEEVFSDSIENWDGEPSGDWPTNDWGVPFPAAYLDTSLSSCSRPPQ